MQMHSRWQRLQFTFHYASTLSALRSVVRPAHHHLHSTMLLLYLYPSWCGRWHVCHLHSTMLLLYLDVPCFFVMFKLIYIPLCFYFIAFTECSLLLSMMIYIPLCFYFIPTDYFPAASRLPFTFHYASTLSVFFLLYVPAQFSFTFHYASTLSVYLYFSTSFAPIYIPLCFYFITTSRSEDPVRNWEFTFHYASTLSGSPVIYQNRKNIFTFHYASTLSMKELVRELAVSIYIPLCFYFINAAVYSWLTGEDIYIPLCFYFIPSPISTSFFFNTRILFVHPVSTLDSPQKSSSSHFTKYEFSLIFQALSISQQFSSISGRQSQEITCLIIIHSPELLRYPLLISAFKYD